MTDDVALIAAMRAEPDSDTPRLVYADWLDERGDPARAEFIRVQCRLSAGPPGTPAWARDHRREAELLAENAAAWRVPYRHLDLDHGAEFDRGFPAFLYASTIEPFVLFWEMAQELTPTDRLILGYVGYDYRSDGDAGRLARCPGLLGVRELWTHDTVGALPQDALAGFARAEFAQNLTRLSLGSPHQVPDCRLLAAEPVLPRLAHLTCRDLSDAVALLESPHRHALRGLEVWYLGDDGVRELCRAPDLARLTHLDLGGCGLTPAGARRLAECPYLDRIEFLAVWDSDDRLGVEGRTILAGRFGARVRLDPAEYVNGPALDARRYELSANRPAPDT